MQGRARTPPLATLRTNANNTPKHLRSGPHLLFLLRLPLSSHALRKERRGGARAVRCEEVCVAVA